MRTELRAAALATVLFLGGLASAQQDPHSGPGAQPADLQQLTPEQRRDAIAAYSQIVCKCPVENWSKTLASCPDSCADMQKGMVLRRVAEGWTIPRIVAEQVEKFGSKAAADPGSSRDGSFWIVVCLTVGAAAAIGLLYSWRRRPAPAGAPSHAPSRAASGAEMSAIERELREID